MRNIKITNKQTMLVSIIKFSQLILSRYVLISVWAGAFLGIF